MNQVINVALKVTDILRNKGVRSCLSGGVACVSYGCTQVPTVSSPNVLWRIHQNSSLSHIQSIDIVALTNEHTADEIKALISAEDPEDFFIHQTPLGDSTTPPHTTLYCKIERRLACKVVILVPGAMGITIDLAARMHHGLLNGHPVLALPSILLLLLKLNAWNEHRKSEFPEEKWKQYTDTHDINQMVEVAAEKGDHLKDCFWIPAESVGAGKRLFRDFAKHSLASDIKLWNHIGFSRFEYY